MPSPLFLLQAADSCPKKVTNDSIGQSLDVLGVSRRSAVTFIPIPQDLYALFTNRVEEMRVHGLLILRLYEVLLSTYIAIMYGDYGRKAGTPRLSLPSIS